MKPGFWHDFWEGMNPAWWLAWALYGLGHLVSLLLRWDSCALMYPAYNWLMLRSLNVQQRFGLSGPWEDARCHDGKVQP